MNTEVLASSATALTHAAGPDVSLSTRHGASIASGLLKHGEHFPDLILVQGATKDRRFFDTYKAMIQELVAGIEKGSMTVNEKVDGLPAIMLGLNHKDRPFVATKHGFDLKTQKLISSIAGVGKVYPTNADMRKLFRECMRFLGPRVKEALTGEFKDLVIQGDIVFTSGDEKRRKEIGDFGVRFTPNSVQYTVPRGDPLHDRVEKAYVGVVIHTVYTRTINQKGKAVEIVPHPDQRLVEKLAERLSSPAVAVMHPWRDDVRFSPSADFKSTAGAKVESLLEAIDSRLKLLSDDFIAAWNTTHLDKMRVFINSGVNPPMHGGLFKAVRGGEEFDYEKFVTGMRPWLEMKAGREEDSDKKKDGSYTKYREKFEELVQRHPTELRAMLGAFYAAVQAQDALIPHLKPVLASRFGGEPGEGIMLRSNGMVVKFIDRLDFTMRNNARWRRDTLPEPFNEWRQGMRLIPMKLQPMHAGHVAMIRKVVAEANGAPVVVIASRKQPNTRGKTYTALGAAENKGKLAEGKYVHLFSRALRSKLFEAADLAGARVCIVDTSIMEKYLDRMDKKCPEGKIQLVIGEKEIAENRYERTKKLFGHLIEEVPQPMQEGGMSGTEIREALKAYANSGDSAAFSRLNEALSYVASDKKRAALIERMCVEFRKVERAAQRILATTPKKRAKKSKE